MKNKLFLLVVLAMVVLCAGQALAYDYTIVFGDAGPSAGSVTFSKPTGSALYAVSSKFNQPRSEGTNPHRGVDLGCGIGTPIYPVYAGWITYQSTYTIEMRLDINNNGVKDDNLYCSYYHLSANNYYATGTYVTTANKIGLSGDQDGQYAAHLHFGLGQDSGTDGAPDIWIRNEPYYRGSSNWNYGKDLDFISLVKWLTNNTLELTAYGMSSGYKMDIAAGDVICYHRLSTGSAWTASTMTKSGDVFTYNLRNSYAAGSSIHYMARATRTDLSTSYYRVAFQKPKFAQPDPNPNATAYKYDYYAATVQ